MKARKIVDKLLESDVNPKSFVNNAQPNYNVTFVAQCPFTDMHMRRKKPRPNYYDSEEGDWQPDWDCAEHFELKDYVHKGVLDENDLPFGTESIILVNPDGSPGEEIPVSALPGRFFGVDKIVDTQSPEDSDMEHWNPPDAFE